VTGIVGSHNRSTVLFPPPGIVEACQAEVINCFSIFAGDRKLRIGDHCVPVSTDALMSRSAYFSSMFGRGFKESANVDEISLDVPDEDSFFHVLYYLMTGTMRDLTLDNFAGVVQNAEFVQSEQLLEYLQQVAVAYYKELFDCPWFGPPQISGDFVKGCLQKAKVARKVRSLYEAADWIGCWMGSHVEQAGPVLDFARQLFPLPQLKPAPT